MLLIGDHVDLTGEQARPYAIPVHALRAVLDESSAQWLCGNDKLKGFSETIQGVLLNETNR
jgi:hypothetical protein